MHYELNSSFSITGYWIHIDENGDAEGNYSLLALDTVHETKGLYPIGVFQRHGQFLPRLILQKKISWPNDVIPKDSPICGFEVPISSKIGGKRLKNC